MRGPHPSLFILTVAVATLAAGCMSLEAPTACATSGRCGEDAGADGVTDAVVDTGSDGDALADTGADGDALADADAAVDAGGDAADAGPCSKSLPGPPMVDAGGYCIDTTEVTQAQYLAFLTAKGTDYSGQTGFCVDRPYTVGGGPGCSWTPSTTPNLPVTCIDWCKAAAYCKWAGKRLCGKIGGGATPLSDFDKPSVDQWHKACSVSGSVFWPYGGVPSSSACVTDKTASSVQNVKSKASCVGPFAPFDGVFDMSGNAAEWTDSCGTVGGETQCRVRGGAFDSTTYQAACNADRTIPWAFVVDSVGVRCCAD